MKSIFGGLTIIFLIVLVFTSISIIGKNINSLNLDDRSQTTLNLINDNLNNDFNLINLTESSSSNGTVIDKTAFGFEFQSASSSATEKFNLLGSLKNIPEIIVSSFGVDDTAFRPFITVLKWFIGALLSLILFDAIFTRRVFNK